MIQLLLLMIWNILFVVYMDFQIIWNISSVVYMDFQLIMASVMCSCRYSKVERNFRNRNRYHQHEKVYGSMLEELTLRLNSILYIYIYIYIIYIYIYIFTICSSIIQYRVLNRLKGKSDI